MLKLVYDLKTGFEDCYLTIKANVCDLTQMLEVEKYSEAEYLEDIEELEHRTVDLDALREDSEESFYQQYHNDTSGLLKHLEESGLLNCLREGSIRYISGTFFSHLLTSDEEIPVWEPSNWKLEYDPTQRSSFFYIDAMPAKEVCDTLKLTRQQLHYYVKAGQIRKEFNPENTKQFKYNRTDVYVMQKKLEKKYDRYNR